MNSITTLNSQFVATFEPVMIENKFLRKGYVYHRIVNGKIVQLLSIKKYNRYEYTIQFLIFPLCIKMKYSTFRDDERMDEYFADVQTWEFETDEYLEQMQLVLKQTAQYLLPLFDTIINYRSYYDNLISKKWNQVLNPSVFILSLYLGEYDVSQKSREAYFELCIKNNQNRWGTDYHINPAMQKQFEEDYKEYDCLKAAMNRNDRVYIEEFIHANEQESLNSYVKAFCTPKKYEHYIETGFPPFEYVKL